MRMRLTRTNVFAPILLAMVFVTAGNAFGMDTEYSIIAQHSRKCLDVEGGPSAIDNGVQVIQRNCIAGAENQIWTITSVGDNYVKIVAKHSGKALDVYGGIFTFWGGAPVKQWDYWGGANQMWQLIPLEGGSYRIMARHSGKSLEIQSGADQAQQGVWMNQGNQRWILSALPAIPSCQSNQSFHSSFFGTLELRTTHPYARGPFYMIGSAPTVTFANCSNDLGFSPILPSTFVFDIPLLGRNQATITTTAEHLGSFDYANGRIFLPVTVRLENANALLGTSTMRMVLLAEGADMENSTTGEATLRGTGIFNGGALGGSGGTVIFRGVFRPRPR
ncbi:MAG TPA: RICIN domain-containing protein [Pyrinomonadaceae bacterium]|nr:RICIN domain-containing protein [Pyrinomonadaceae bacterium]